MGIKKQNLTKTSRMDVSIDSDPASLNTTPYQVIPEATVPDNNADH